MNVKWVSAQLSYPDSKISLFIPTFLFNPPKRNMRMRREIFELKPSINMNRIFEKFGNIYQNFAI
jgi:hypothetical protein